MKILVFYVDKQYFNMVTLFLRLRVRRELIIRRDGRAVEGTGLENRRCESIRGFESHPVRQIEVKSRCFEGWIRRGARVQLVVHAHKKPRVERAEYLRCVCQIRHGKQMRFHPLETATHSRVAKRLRQQALTL